MSNPDEALERARSAVRSMRAAGAYSEQTRRARPPTGAGAVSHTKLMEWAVIEPDLSLVRSTRRFGAALPMALKRGLLRLLLQYHAELTGQQTRFNVHLLGALMHLESRLDALERRLNALDDHRR